jgi:hypothetical protein
LTFDCHSRGACPREGGERESSFKIKSFKIDKDAYKLHPHPSSFNPSCICFVQKTNYLSRKKNGKVKIDI